jgi:uncharacterized glyoxalase superfamily protein PhnB
MASMPDARPPGFHTVTPRLFTPDPAALVEFLRAVFGATSNWVGDAPAEVHLGDSVLMINGTSVREEVTGCFYVYVPDADATYSRALAAGASSMEEPLDAPYGDRRAMVRDPFGNIWQIATYRERETGP